MGNILKRFFPCMSGDSSQPETTTIKIISTSACCRGKIIEVQMDSSYKQEFNEIVNDFIEKIQLDKDNPKDKNIKFVK